MSYTRRVRFNGEEGPTQRRLAAPIRGILKQQERASERDEPRDLRREVVTDFSRKPVVTETGLKILPTKNPTVPPFRRSRTHRHGSRTMRVRVVGHTSRKHAADTTEDEANKMERDELIKHLTKHFDRIKETTKASTEMLRTMYVNAKLSGLLKNEILCSQTVDSTIR